VLPSALHIGGKQAKMNIKSFLKPFKRSSSANAVSSATNSTQLRLKIDVRSKSYEREMSGLITSLFFKDMEEAYLKSDQFKNDFAEHLYKRYQRFADHLVPWAESFYPDNQPVVLEIGSGSGSSTLAFAPTAKHIHCYEIDDKSTECAKRRLDFFNIKNVSFENELFNQDARFVREGRRADIILLVAVLEHLTHDEFQMILRTSVDVLNPGGIIVISETPNRLTVTDFHTSWIPFYQWLTPELQQTYYDRSPRQHFVHDIGDIKKTNPTALRERLTRWGNGVSYHDFELAIGPDVHSWIVADGWEEGVRPLAPIFPDDEILLDVFKKMHIKANKAFARSWLYMILKKPK
jgi:2-polyprenyl-3-methyl-5-hydroxy-6-metoxy-1,4-benzoquinol methylase